MSDIDGHRMRYRMAPMPPAPDGHVLATISVDLPGRPQSDDARWWWSVSRKGLQTFGKTWAGQFSVDIQISRSINIAPNLKPMLDGLIASLQAHHGSDRERIIAVSGTHDDDAAAKFWAEATHTERAVLGVARLLAPGKSKPHWSPGDDRCSAFRIARFPVENDRLLVSVRPHV